MVAIVRFVQNHAAAPWPVWEPNKTVGETMTIQADQGPSTTPNGGLAREIFYFRET